ncbi:hypothetical protein HDU96_000162 [Phlyctochytrium bullatum]|nr:hypothetical protein HDU96_000162 [Phlyctochytrium bullatum]
MSADYAFMYPESTKTKMAAEAKDFWNVVMDDASLHAIVDNAAELRKIVESSSDISEAYHDLSEKLGFAFPTAPVKAPGNGVCFEDNKVHDHNDVNDGNVSVLSSTMFEKLKVILLEITILLYAKCGIQFKYAVAFGWRAARTLKSLSNPKIAQVTELVHYAAFNYHQKLSKLLVDSNEDANKYEDHLVTSITVLYAKALVPKLAELLNGDDRDSVRKGLRLHFGDAMIRVDIEKASMALSDIKSYLAYRENKDLLLQPLRSLAQHRTLNSTKVAEVIVKPTTQVLPTIASVQAPQEQQEAVSLADEPLAQASNTHQEPALLHDDFNIHVFAYKEKEEDPAEVDQVEMESGFRV